jgi:hypothetical protein
VNKKKRWDVSDPEVRHMVEQMKREIAREFGIQIPLDGYWGDYASKELGKIGSQLKKRLTILLERRTEQKKKQKKRN